MSPPPGSGAGAPALGASGGGGARRKLGSGREGREGASAAAAALAAALAAAVSGLGALWRGGEFTHKLALFCPPHGLGRCGSGGQSAGARRLGGGGGHGRRWVSTLCSGNRSTGALWRSRGGSAAASCCTGRLRTATAACRCIHSLCCSGPWGGPGGHERSAGAAALNKGAVMRAAPAVHCCCCCRVCRAGRSAAETVRLGGLGSAGGHGRRRVHALCSGNGLAGALWYSGGACAAACCCRCRCCCLRLLGCRWPGRRPAWQHGSSAAALSGAAAGRAAPAACCCRARCCCGAR